MFLYAVCGCNGAYRGTVNSSSSDQLTDDWLQADRFYVISGMAGDEPDGGGRGGAGAETEAVQRKTPEAELSKARDHLTWGYHSPTDRS